MAKKQLAPADVETWAAKHWRAHHQDWLADAGGWPARVVLSTLTEKDVMADVAGARAWIAAWTRWQEQGRPGRLEWEERRWSSGRQQLPTAISFSAPQELAVLLGQAPRWERARQRYGEVVARWPCLAGQRGLVRHFEELADYDETSFTRLIRLIAWLAANPASGLYLRQLPVAGFDTKWAETRKGLVVDLMRVLHGRPEERSFEALCGLRVPSPRVRMRILCDELRRSVGGLSDVEAPLEQLATLALRPQVALIVENLASGLALPDLSGAVAFMRLGHSVDLLERIDWLHSVPRHLYWGDLDTHGLAILARARLMFPAMESVLMDETTLLAHRDLWVEEPQPSTSETLQGLTPAEQELFTGLRNHRWGANVRLEQERLDWPTVLNALRETLLMPLSGSFHSSSRCAQ